jgi:hypothetical protein
MATVRVSCSSCGAQFDVVAGVSPWIVECPNCHSRLEGSSEPAVNHPIGQPAGDRTQTPRAQPSPAMKEISGPATPLAASLAHFLWAGLLGFFLGAAWVGGCTALHRYSPEAYQQQVGRAERAEQELRGLADKRKDRETVASQAKLEAKSSQEKLLTVQQKSGERPAVATRSLRDSTSQIPDDLSYSVISDSGNGRLLVRLSREATDENLRAVAMQLQLEHPHSHNPYGQRTAAYILPGMEDNVMVWATASFDPSRSGERWKVTILGLSIEQEARLLEASSRSQLRGVLGRWFDDTNKRLLTIFREDAKLFVERRFEDNSTGTTELVQADSNGGKRFDYRTPAPGQDPGGYLLINDNGNLEEWVPASPEVQREFAGTRERFDGGHGLYVTARPARAVPTSQTVDQATHGK